uniref:Uncharacterized protein n=1 Tax=Glossina austeni TaxID=7395 RepID=A0A1A9VDW9_GLOAU
MRYGNRDEGKSSWFEIYIPAGTTSCPGFLSLYNYFELALLSAININYITDECTELCKWEENIILERLVAPSFPLVYKNFNRSWQVLDVNTAKLQCVEFVLNFLLRTIQQICDESRMSIELLGVTNSITQLTQTDLERHTN